VSEGAAEAAPAHRLSHGGSYWELPAEAGELRQRRRRSPRQISGGFCHCQCPALSTATPQAAAQLAVWAVANNPPRGRVAHFLDSVVRRTQAPELERHRLLTVAANLVRAAQLDPAKFAMFR